MLTYGKRMVTYAACLTHVDVCSLPIAPRGDGEDDPMQWMQKTISDLPDLRAPITVNVDTTCSEAYTSIYMLYVCVCVCVLYIIYIIYISCIYYVYILYIHIMYVYIYIYIYVYIYIYIYMYIYIYICIYICIYIYIHIYSNIHAEVVPLPL
jgi:hypothetical protein